MDLPARDGLSSGLAAQTTLAQRLPFSALHGTQELLARRAQPRQACAAAIRRSVPAGAVLQKTPSCSGPWLLRIFFVARDKQGISALQLQRDARLVSTVTACLLLHKLLAALGPDPSRLLRGRVEVDGSYLFAPHEKGRGGGRAAGRKTLVAAVVERMEHGHLRLGVVRSHTFEDDLGPFVRGSSKAPGHRAPHRRLDAYDPWPGRPAFATCAVSRASIAHAA